MGHGGEIPKSKIKNIVPPGCTLVVEVHSGEVSYSDDNRFINYPNKSIYLDPINNYKELVKAISNTQRTLAIYKEGDEYPDFSYTLLSYWTSESSNSVNPNEIRLRDSGIMEYPFESIQPKYIKPVDDIYDINSKNLDIFVDQFRNSIYPSQKRIKDFIDDNTSTNLNENNRINTLKDIIESYDNFSPRNTEKIRILGNKYMWNHKKIMANNEYNKIKNPEPSDILNIKNVLNVKQSQLFKDLPPGVFYNLVCRSTSDAIRETANVFIKNFWFPLSRQILKNSTRSLIPKNTRKNKKQSLLIPEIMGQISEAELQRKPYIKQLGFNTINTSELEREIRNYKNVVDGIKKQMLDTNNTYGDLKENLTRWKNVIDKKEKELEGLEKLKPTPRQNTSTNNYTWEKQKNNRWRSVTIKNRKNKPVSGDLEYTGNPLSRIQVNSVRNRNRNNKDPLEI